MTRSHLLGAASAAALACFATGAFAQAPTTVTGGGSTLAEFDYDHEFTTFNGMTPPAAFNNVDPRGGTIVYWPSGSGTGQASFFADDNTCNSSKVITGTATCSGGGGANAVAYGAADNNLSSTQISSWATLPFGKAVSGGLIQVPSMGIGIAIPVVNSSLKKNGGVTLTDNDLCEIFTGAYSNWNQTSAASKLAAGTITVTYRGDGSGTSFIFLNHLLNVCTAANPPISSSVHLSATTSFYAIFPTAPTGIFTKAYLPSGTTSPTYYTPANFVPESGSQNVASYLSSKLGTTVTSGTAYLSPDFTSIDPKSDAVLTDGTKSKLLVPKILNPNDKTAGAGGTANLPNTAGITNGLNNALAGTDLTPPTNPADPSQYIPLIQTTSKGYSLVGYTTFDFAQCYKNLNIGTSINNFLNDHYGVTAYKTIEKDNGFVNLNSTKAAGFVTVIKSNILANTSGNNLNFDNPTVCKNIGR